MVARSSAEAELRAMCSGICEGIWLLRMLKELKIYNSGTINLLCDNKAAIEISRNPVHHDRTKHEEIDRHFTAEKIEGGILKPNYVHTSYQTSDILTKALTKNNFEGLKSKLCLTDIYNPA